MQKIRKWIFLSGLCLLLVTGCASGETTQEPVTYDSMPTNSTPIDSTLTVHFIDVGQGDSTLVVCDGEAMLIDAGDNSKGTTVQLYLKKQNVEQLKYVIGTHPDADHIGGMDVILYKYHCETVIMPDVASDTAAYRDVVDTLKQKNYSVTLPKVQDEYQLGNATFQILGPCKNYEDINNCSVAIKLQHGENSFLFTGDAEGEAEADYLASGMDLQADVLKVAHHGSSSSTGDSFLKKVAPEYAVISCGKDNAYGHPHGETIERLGAENCTIYRTDEQGHVIANSDGTTITWNCEPSDTKIEHSTESQEPIPVSPQATYILNTNTKKFHNPTCPSVKQMKEKNKKETMDSRETIISQGYVPCKNCNP